MSDIKWYYAAGSEQRGPLNDADMVAMVREGVIRPETMIWQQGMTDWQPAQEVLPPNLIPASWASQAPPMPVAPVVEGGAISQAGQAIGQNLGQALGQNLSKVGLDFSAGHSELGEYHHPTDFVDVVKTVLSRYVQFSGRARRSEFWFWTLFVWVVFVVGFGLAAAIGAVLGEFVGGLLSVVVSLFALAILLPNLALAVRRLHDTGRSGWWLLVAFVPFVGSVVLLVFYILPGQPENNQFGAA